MTRQKRGGALSIMCSISDLFDFGDNDGDDD